MSFTLDQLKEKKKLLEEKRAAVKAEEKYLEEEKARLLAKLRELGYSSLSEAKEALVQMENEILRKESELEELLSTLENSSAEKPVEHASQTVFDRKPIIDSIDDL